MYLDFHLTRIPANRCLFVYELIDSKSGVSMATIKQSTQPKQLF